MANITLGGKTWKPDYSVTPQRIVCAANRHANGTIVLGIRHCDATMNGTFELRQKLHPNELWRGCDQGFVDQFGNYISREGAWIIACAANQIHRLVGGQTKEDIGKPGIRLYSENLY